MLANVTDNTLPSAVLKSKITSWKYIYYQETVFQVFPRACPVQWHVASGGDEAVDRGVGG